MKKKVILYLEDDDVEWLEKVYGDRWTRRMEAHIHNEVRLRANDEEGLLKMREPWNY